MRDMENVMQLLESRCNFTVLPARLATSTTDDTNLAYLVERLLHHGVVALLAEVVEILPSEVHLL